MNADVDPLTGDLIRAYRPMPRWLNPTIWALQAWCWVWGHDDVQQYDNNRLFLGCATCGRTTPGWTVTARRDPILPTVRRGAAR